jgi:conjugal transfer pilus assembly protein TraW
MKWSSCISPVVFVAILLIILLINFLITLKVEAVDLGVWGESSITKEEDFETYIVKKLEALGEDKLRAHQEFIKDKIVADIKRPRAVQNISQALNSAVRLFDPTFEVEENIYDQNNQLLYPRGMRVNPLEKKEFEEIWIIIDGDDATQVEFANNYQEPNTTATTSNKLHKIILINGSPGAQEDGSFFFFDQQGEISKKLNISKVPSVIRQYPAGPQILIEEIALDEDGKEILSTDNGRR